MRLPYSRRLSLLALTTLSSIILFACAQGAPDPQADTLPINAADNADGGSGVDGSVAASADPNADNDHDGYLAKDDCNDHDGDIHPGVIEICNGKDDNCDGKIDEGFDTDGDGWVTCAVGSRAPDCDDKDPTVNPGAAEVCNAKDDNCDGKIDEGFDKDNDGYYACVRNGLAMDCDDTDPLIHPGGTETCNGKDDDCDGVIDELPANIIAGTSPPNTHWSVAGSAQFFNNWAILTPDQTYQAGAVWWSTPYLFDSFDVLTTFLLPTKVNCADGFAFAFIPSTVPVTSVGAAGYGYGYEGLGGYAVAIDTFSNVNEPVAPFITVIDGAHNNTALARQSIPEVRDGVNHTLRVTLDGGKISVWVDAVSYIFELPLPGYVPFTGRWGFTAGTGGYSCVQAVRDVSMGFSSGQGCLP